MFFIKKSRTVTVYYYDTEIDLYKSFTFTMEGTRRQAIKEARDRLGYTGNKKNVKIIL